MAQERNAHDVRKATSDGLQRIYLIIIGFAITQALKQTLTDNNGFLGPKLEDDAHWPSILFLIAFLFTVIRFAHGSVLHLTALKGQKKWQWDMLVLITQAIMFFILALTTTEPTLFLLLFPVIMIIDSVWLMVLCFIGPISKMEGEWLISNILLSIAFILLLYCNLHALLSIFKISALSVLSCVIAAFFDYYVNRHEYFPT